MESALKFVALKLLSLVALKFVALKLWSLVALAFVALKLAVIGSGHSFVD